MVDALRGYALLGLFMVHCVERFELYWLDPQPDAWFDGTMAVFAGKAFAIFALLFGFSFATIMANERARGGDFTCASPGGSCCCSRSARSTRWSTAATSCRCSPRSG